MQRVRISSHQSPVHKLGDHQMTLSPKFRLAASPPPSSGFSPSTLPPSYPLIPGLPDDVAFNCLLRLPVDTHPTCRSVCRRWHLLLAGKDRFFTCRKALGFSDPWLFVFASRGCIGKLQWQVLDLTRLAWHAIPPMPSRNRICPRRSRCVAVPGEASVIVCGGAVWDSDRPLDLVLKYEMGRNRWTVMSRMLAARSSFACSSIDGRIFVAGGNGREFSELSLAECLVEGRSWRPVASMGAGMAAFDAAVLGGRLFVAEGWVWPFLFSPRGQVYDPKLDRWEEMAVGMREGWTGYSVVVEGHLFVVSEYEGMRVKVYDMASDSWETVADGSPVPGGRIRKPISVSSCGDRIYVVGYGLHIAVGYVQRVNYGSSRSGGSSTEKEEEEERWWRFCIRWQELDAPGAFADLTPCGAQVVFA